MKKGSPGFFFLAFFFTLFFVSFIPLPLAAQAPNPGILLPPGGDQADLNTVRAREEFRIGVQAYNRYAFNEAILSLERALSFRPGEPLILEWLGRSYYRSGFEETALRQWRSAAAGYGYSSGPGILLSSRAETVRNRRSFLPLETDPALSPEEFRFVESGRYPSKNGDILLYRQPSAVLPLEDGSAWVVAYGSNEIVRIDVNGIIRDRRRGPLNGFDRPYDLVRGQDGRLYLSELRGGRVSVLSGDGEWQYYIGAKGRGAGQFVGPQNLALDEEGYLYVVDYGNRRISKFDPSGAFILSFGDKTPGFPGFISPSGIAAGEGRIFAADNISNRIFMFDRNGAYLGVLVGEGLSSPESLRFTEDGKILAADSNRILLIEPDTAIVRELGVLGNPSRVKITGAEVDRNGNVLAADFKTGEVAIMTRMEDIASGLFVQIDRIAADDFPVVTVELRVQDRFRRPIVGLDARNFILSEEGRTVAEQNFLGAAYLSGRADISILVERSAGARELRDEMAAAVRDISAAGAGIVSLVSAGEQPRRESLTPQGAVTPARQLQEAARGSAASYTPRWRFDLGLRLAVTDLLPGEKKRAVVFVGQGAGLGELAFEQYGLSELAAYMANNDVVFYAVILGGTPPGGEIRYLCEATGGAVLPLYRNEGVGQEIQKLTRRPSGCYALSYRSLLPTDYGRTPLPLEAEVYLMERSGRDGAVYFAPLE
ncbi:MAG: NHL repeat-containing protein [Treponema sp.]|jgi:DNA-binding beta-propeller fold protein YncE|nr:NHL repeat-containing protein [Treponema sp.]